MEELELGYNSQLFARAVEALMQLPGVGRKSAQRYMLHLLQRGEMQDRFVQPIAPNASDSATRGCYALPALMRAAPTGSSA